MKTMRAKLEKEIIENYNWKRDLKTYNLNNRIIEENRRKKKINYPTYYALNTINQAIREGNQEEQRATRRTPITYIYIENGKIKREYYY